MSKKSAGLLLYRVGSSGTVEVLLVHPGGPFWAKKDEGAWSIPKGEFQDDEDPLSAAKREFAEETGVAAPTGAMTPLGPARQPGGKLVYAWAVESDFNPLALKSNTFSLEWPPKSGRRQEFPESIESPGSPSTKRAGRYSKARRSFWRNFSARSRTFLPAHSPDCALAALASAANVDAAERSQDAEHIQKPQNDNNHHHCVQYRFYGSRHWYELIDQPQ